jgi:hypothetical protein
MSKSICTQCKFYRKSGFTHECHLTGPMDYVTGLNKIQPVVDCYTKNSTGDCSDFKSSSRFNDDRDSYVFSSYLDR